MRYLGLLCVSVLLSGNVWAAPLALDELDSLITRLHCTENCASFEPEWDKNQDSAYTETDASLSALEFWDDASLVYLCYDNQTVLPISQCGVPSGGSTSLPANWPGSRDDNDGDGIPEFEELKLGLSDDPNDNDMATSCQSNAACAFLTEACMTVCNILLQHQLVADPSECANDGYSGSICWPRNCSESTTIGGSDPINDALAAAGQCGNTAFHLEAVVSDNQELIVHVHYDYSAIPATVLDLHIDYNSDALTLIDSRRLPTLTSQGKQFGITHPNANTARLIVLDPQTTVPIANGPLIELVFQRISSSQTTVQFSTDNYDQRHSIAPNQDSSSGVPNGYLENDSVWGPPIYVAGASSSGPRLVLNYTFDNTSAPLSYKDVPGRDSLCAASGNSCATLELERDKHKRLEMLETLQKGVVQRSESIQGITGNGVYLDGSFDHLRLPVHLNQDGYSDNENTIPSYPKSAQDFSASFWFYAEGNNANELGSTPQVLFSHNNSSKHTHFGVMLQHDNNALALKFFRGEIVSFDNPAAFETTVLNPDIPLRVWTHLGMTVDAQNAVLDFYINGVKVTDPSISVLDAQNNAAAIQCPGLTNDDVGLYEEGNNPDTLFYASTHNNLYGIEQMDLAGMSRQTVIRDGIASYRDPDYLPLYNKIVYSSNASGNFEIWVADADGDENSRRQITVGFGDTGRGIFAQRPRWAPDGSGIIFESNIFSVPYGHNLFERVYHLYYIAYDPENNSAWIPTGDGSFTTELDFEAISARGTIEDYRITKDDARNHNNVAWLQGANAVDNHRGRIVLNSSDDQFGDNQVRVVTLPENLHDSTTSILPLHLDEANGRALQERSLLSGFSKVENGEVTEKVVYQRNWHTYDSTSQFFVQWSEVNDVISATITHTAAGYQDQCWDTDNAEGCTAEEDTNNDGACTLADCYPYDVRNLYLAYDPAIAGLDYDARSFCGCNAGNFCADDWSCTSNDATTPNPKELDLKDFSTMDPVASYIRVEILSPIDNRPIPDGVAVAKVVFNRLNPGDPGLILNTRNRQSAVYVKELSAPDPTYPSCSGPTDWIGDGRCDATNNNANCGWDGGDCCKHTCVSSDYNCGVEVAYNCQGAAGTKQPLVISPLEQISAGAFSPSGDSLVLSGISKARPTLVKYKINPGINDYPQKLSINALNTQGLSWKMQERYYPCHWIGAFRNPNTKAYDYGFRGGLDELRIHSYVRPTAAFVSEAARGTERLDDEERDGPVESKMLVCASGMDSDCPPYHQCLNQTCQMIDCDPSEPYPCDNGRCTLRPLSVEQETGDGVTDYEWVCATECNATAECFMQECLNGPCRFCEEKVCLECRDSEMQLGDVTISNIEGCPDRNSFACDSGSCISECYSVENGQSVYLCDPSLEYCYQGRCLLMDWDWDDIAPASFSGLGETKFRHPDINYTTAISQLFPVEIKAYGVGDYGHAPEVVVEGKYTPAYGDKFFEIGRILVHAKTQVEAQQQTNLYTVLAPYPITDLRLRLVNPPFQNLSASATGLMGKDEGLHFAGAFNKASGSRANIGYRVGIPTYESYHACSRHGGAGCSEGPNDDDFRPYLYGGQPSVVFLDVSVNGQSILTTHMTKNLVCSYEGDDIALGQNSTPKKVYFGPSEDSNQQDFYGQETWGSDLIDFTQRSNEVWALLNCNYADPNDPDLSLAQVLFSGITIIQGQTAGKITEVGYSCSVEIDQDRREPCYEWIGSDPSFDILNAPTEIYNTLDFSSPKGFGHVIAGDDYYGN